MSDLMDKIHDVTKSKTAFENNFNINFMRGVRRIWPKAIFGLENNGFSFNNTFIDRGDTLDLREVAKFCTAVSFSSTAAYAGEPLLHIYGADELFHVRNIGTQVAITMVYFNMPKATIDKLFSDLPPTTRTATIDVRNNPGSASCDPTIATAKGYTVVV